MASQLLSDQLLKRIARLRLHAKHPRQGRASGAYRSRTKGLSMDLAGYRQYFAGDDIRWIDWAVYGRLEKLYMKTFFEEQDSGVWLLLDASASMGAASEAKWLLARQLAAALGAVSLYSQNPLTLGVLHGTEMTRHRLGRGIKHLPRLLSVLEDVPCEGVTGLHGAVRRTLLAAPPSLVLLVTDGFDPEGLEEVLRVMSMRGHEGTLLHVLDEQEVTPPLEGDVMVKDAETGEVVPVSMDGEGLARYRLHLTERIDGQRALALARGVDYLRAVAPAPPGPLVLRLLSGHGARHTGGMGAPA